jgi:hypothetical protein
MKKNLNLLLFSFFISKILFCQTIENNSYIADVDEPFQFNKELVKGNYRVSNIYTCPDTIFSKQKCICRTREIFNDSGRIVKLISGNDLDNSKINYIVSYISTNDSVCEVMSEFFSHYIDSVSTFAYYDPTKKKTTVIYQREPKTKNIKIKSILLYPTRSSLPDTIFRYDMSGQLKQIYYPLGNRKPVKTWEDSAVSRDSKTFYSHFIFRENQYHSYATFSKKGRLLERGETNISNDSTAHIRRTIFIYDDSSRLIYKNAMDEKNSFIESEHFFYDSGVLIKHTIDRNLDDSVDNEIRIYNKAGKLLELFQKAEGYPYDTWKWLYIYQGLLQHRTDYFRTGKYQGSTFFIYSSSQDKKYNN